MDIRKLDDRVSVSPQISPADFGRIAAEGFRTVVCNRPDDEAPGQPAFADIAAAGKLNGIAVVFLPVTAATMGPDIAASFSEAVANSGGPVLAYCRTGTRSATLWSITQAMSGAPADAILASAGSAGYDMTATLQRMGL